MPLHNSCWIMPAEAEEIARPSARIAFELRLDLSPGKILPMILEEIAEYLVLGHASKVDALTSAALDAGHSANEVLDRGLIAGMSVVGLRFKNGEMFLPEVLTSARAMKAGMRHLEPLLRGPRSNSRGKCIIGTVKGDIHDIGKNLVSILLQSSGIEVVDLGTGVSAEQFLEAIRIHRPQLLAMSAMLTTTMTQMKSNMDAFRAAGVLAEVKILVGGAPVNASFAEEIGATAYGRDAGEGAALARGLLPSEKNF